MRSVSLKTIKDVKRLYAKIINQYKREEIPSQRFRDFVYGLSKFSEILKASDLEERIEALENKEVE